MNKLPENLQLCVESLCGDGCQAVNGYIQQLERGGSVPQTELLSYEDRQEVLKELKSIMAVYDGKCQC